MNVKSFSMRRHWAVAVGMCLVASVAMAQPKNVSLADAIAMATQNDVQVRSMQAQLEAAQEKEAQAKSRFMPQLQYTRFGTNTKRSDMESAFRDRDYENRQWGLELQLSVYRRENQVVLDQARLEVTQAQERLKLARAEILTKATKAYLDVIKAVRQWEFVSLQLAHAHMRWGLFQKQYQNGALSELEVMDSQAKYLYARSQTVQVQNDIAAKRLELQRLLGVPFVDALMGLPTDISLAAVVSTDREPSHSCLGGALDEHPSVVMGRIGLQLNDNELARANAEFVPTLDLTAGKVGINQTGNAYSAFPSKYKEDAVTLKLTIPIYNGGSSLSKRNEAVALAHKAHATLDAAIAQVEASHHQGIFALENLIEMDNILEPARRVAEASLMRLELAVKGGVRSTLDVLPAREELRKRMLEHELARYDAVHELIKLWGLCSVVGDTQLGRLSDAMSQPIRLNNLTARQN